MPKHFLANDTIPGLLLELLRELEATGELTTPLRHCDAALSPFSEATQVRLKPSCPNHRATRGRLPSSSA